MAFTGTVKQFFTGTVIDNYNFNFLPNTSPEFTLVAKNGLKKEVTEFARTKAENKHCTPEFNANVFVFFFN